MGGMLRIQCYTIYMDRTVGSVVPQCRHILTFVTRVEVFSRHFTDTYNTSNASRCVQLYSINLIVDLHLVTAEPLIFLFVLMISFRY